MSARKPLDLAVYDLEALPHLVAKARTATRRKRLTGPELAAEYHAMDSLLSYAADLPSYLNRQRHGRLRTLHRFATRPHYDEADQ